jgi:iron-sulfur cluster repair protein YtfE (RIC family)
MSEKLSSALEREHREIDRAIEAFVANAADPLPLQCAMDALRRHIYLEEEFLFPPLREAGLSMPIFVMVREHGELWDVMDGLDGLLSRPSATDTTAKACQALLEQLDQHNSKEEPVIYPQADQALSEAATEQLQAFIATGRMPEGWVCERAGGAPSAVGLFGH